MTKHFNPRLEEGECYSELIPNLRSGTMAFEEAFAFVVMWTMAALAVGYLAYGIGRRCTSMVREARKQAARIHDFVTRTPESMKGGSELFTAKPPNYMMALYDYDYDRKQKLYLGSAIRMENWLVTCTHILQEVHGRLMGQVGDHPYEFPEGSEWIDLGSDVSACQLDAKKPIPGLAKAKVGLISREAHVRCCSTRTVGKDNQQNSSVGFLINKMDQAFGMLEYKGSTITGFSGAAYVYGTRVVGIHCGGGAINYGFAADWIMSQLNQVERLAAPPGVVKESNSGLYELKRALRSTTRDRVRTSRTGDPSEIEVQVDGKYWILDMEEYADLISEDFYQDFFVNDDEYERRVKTRRGRRHFEDWDDQEYECMRHRRREPESNATGQWEPMTGNERAPHRDSDESSVGSDTESQVSTTDLIQIIATQQSDMDGLRERLESLLVRLEDMPSTGLKPMQDMIQSLETKVSRLEQNLKKQTKSPIAAPRGQTMQGGVSGSSIASPPSTSQAQQGLAPSQSSPPSARLWVGMDSDVQTFLEWRSSKNTAHVDYAALRTEFLTGMGLTPIQQAVIVARTRNQGKRAQKKRQRRPQSTSSPST